MLESLLVKFSGALHMILGFSFLIFIHELGHFALAKWNGVRVYVFSLGMGPYLFSFTYKGTVYALSMLPIGGYVKMMGQDDMNAELAPTRDKTDYRNKRPGQKAAILAAGAIFNLIFALFAFTTCYYVGIYQTPPQLGNVAPDRPLAVAINHKDQGPAHLKKGDMLIEVNHIPVKFWIEAAIFASGTPRGEDLWLKVERDPANKGSVDKVVVHPKEEKRLGATSIGLEKYRYFQEVPLGFTTQNNLVVVSDPKKNKETANAPGALAGLQKGDIILAIADPDNPSPTEVKLNTLEAQYDFTNTVRGSNGRRLTLTILRGTETKRVDITPLQNEKFGWYWVGVGMGIAHRKVTSIDPESEAYKGGLREGDFVIGFIPDQSKEEVWSSGTLKWTKEWGTEDESAIQSAKIRSIPGSAALAFYQEREAIYKYQETEFARALGTAWEDLINYSKSVFGVLRGLFSGDVSPKALSGAVGIGASMYTVANNEDFMNFLWFLGFISLNLGVLQFLPVPLLDGWHLLMLLVEKVKGAPVSMEWQIRFQYVGLFMIGSLLLLSFYNDISRIIGF